MHHLTTRELLYLEDMSSLFESIAKNCDYAAGGTVKYHSNPIASPWVMSTSNG